MDAARSKVWDNKEWGEWRTDKAIVAGAQEAQDKGGAQGGQNHAELGYHSDLIQRSMEATKQFGKCPTVRNFPQIYSLENSWRMKEGRGGKWRELRKENQLWILFFLLRNLHNSVQSTLLVSRSLAINNYSKYICSCYIWFFFVGKVAPACLILSLIFFWIDSSEPLLTVFTFRKQWSGLAEALLAATSGEWSERGWKHIFFFSSRWNLPRSPHSGARR